MQPFMGKDFMLKNETAKHLFHTYSEDLPIIDYHCHIPPQEIYEDRRYNNIAEVWLGGKAADGTYFGDHYKWRGMRSNGVKIYSSGNIPMDLTQTSYSTVPSIDIEVGDRGSDYSTATLNKLASGIVDGVKNYFGEPK